MSTTTRIRDCFDDAGVRGWLHAVPIGAVGTAEVDLDAGRVVPMASVYKLPLLVAFCRLVDDGALDPTEQLRLEPADRTPGPTGISILADPVTMSLRDVATSMMTVSDNAAADALLRRVGLARLGEILQTLELPDTIVRRGTAEQLLDLQDRTGTISAAAAFAVLADNDNADPDGVYDAANVSSTSPRDMTRLLSDLWSGRLLSARQTEFATTTMSRQLQTARLASGFALDGVVVAGKTGTYGALRHEVGVVTLPEGDAYAVAVFTLAARGGSRLPRVDLAIGRAARMAVDHLRSP